MKTQTMNQNKINPFLSKETIQKVFSLIDILFNGEKSTEEIQETIANFIQEVKYFAVLNVRVENLKNKKVDEPFGEEAFLDFAYSFELNPGTTNLFIYKRDYLKDPAPVIRQLPLLNVTEADIINKGKTLRLKTKNLIVNINIVAYFDDIVTDIFDDSDNPFNDLDF